MKNLRTLLFFGFVSSVISSNCNDFNADQRIREREEDQKFHDCRGCQAIETNEESCPLTGFDCDGSQILKANVLTPDDHCTCAQMKCADPRAMLMVDGVLANKVICRNLTWFTPLGDVAETAACARDCVSCPILPNAGYETSPLLEPIIPTEQDGPHHCSGVKCKEGAFGSNADVGPIIHREDVWFACSGGQWRMMNADNSHTDIFYTRLQCIKKRCNDLLYTNPSECPAKYSCYNPQLVNSENPAIEKALQCNEPNALRYTDNVGQIIAPTCFLGQWQVNGADIPDDTNVICINCPAFQKGTSTGSDPQWMSDSNQLVCAGGAQLNIDIFWCFLFLGCHSINPFPTNSIFCDGEFEWDTTEKVFFGAFTLKQAVNTGFVQEWKASCLN